jgi:RNA polymerase sigma-70 factor, ECF subfamily
MHQRPDSDCGDSLIDLIGATARGNQKAFARLYAVTSPKLYGAALRILGRRDLAEDIVQEAYLRIWHHAGRYDPARGSPITWMAAIVRHLAIDMVRNHGTQIQGEAADLFALPADTPHPLDEIALSEKRRRVFVLLHDLDPVKRRLVIAAYLQRFGAPVNTIKTWLRRAVLELRAGLEEDDSRQVA